MRASFPGVRRCSRKLDDTPPPVFELRSKQGESQRRSGGHGQGERGRPVVEVDRRTRPKRGRVRGVVDRNVGTAQLIGDLVDNGRDLTKVAQIRRENTGGATDAAMSAAVPASSSCERAISPTVAPAAARSWTIARPIPRPARRSARCGRPRAQSSRRVIPWCAGCRHASPPRCPPRRGRRRSWLAGAVPAGCVSIRRSPRSQPGRPRGPTAVRPGPRPAAG